MTSPDSTITVRRCSADDVELLTATEAPGARLAETFFARQERGEVVYLVGWWGRNPVSTVVLTTEHRPELKNLHVLEAFRGRGVAGAILAEAERLVGRGTLVIGVSLDNVAARRLYERLGYRPTGRLTTTTYRYVGADGVEREATETDEELEKELA